MMYGLNICKALYTCILIIPVIFLCLFPVRDYLKSRTSAFIFKTVLLYLVFVCISIVISCLFSGLPMKFVISICAGLYFFISYQKEIELPVHKLLFIYLTAFMVSSFSRIFGSLIDIALHPENTYLDISLEGFLFQLLFLAAADVILYIPFTRYLGWLVAHFHSGPVWNCVCLFPALCIFITYVLIPHNYSWMYIGRALQMYLAVILCLIILILILYALFYLFVHAYIEKQRLEHSNEILSIQGIQYQQLLLSVQENSRIRHDFRQQLVVISELLGHKEYDRLADYVSSYIQSISGEIRVYSYLPALNAILSYYESLCHDRHIRTDFTLALPDSLSVTEQDLCVMLGNLLENAVYGCEGVKDPFIRLKIMQTSPHVLAVKISNPCSGSLKNTDGEYLSSRHSGFGQGLKSVHVIAEKYQGCADIQSDSQLFTVKVLLQLPPPLINRGIIICRSLKPCHPIPGLFICISIQ